jgi:protein-S-isoprenylcysteine O-methyltransferase Ste14
MAKRLLVCGVGVATYLLFLATVLYGIGFVGNFGVPKSIDGVPAVRWSEAVAVDLLLVALFGLQHSVMARSGFKAWWTRVVPPSLERSVYVLLSSVALLLLFWLWRPLRMPLWKFDGALALVMQALFWAGWAIAVASSFLIDHFDLFGLRQVWLYWRGEPYRPVRFKQPAAYRWLRHPMMLGFLLAFWATPQMSAGHALFAAAMTVYIGVGIAFEERDLAREHGDAYAHYRREVPMLLPWRRRRPLD